MKRDVRRPGEQGSALMLVPAGVMVLMTLGVISVDSAMAFMAQRELQNAAVSAVNDAVTVAIPPDELARLGSDAQPDLAVADELVRSRLSESPVSNLRITNVSTPRLEGDRMVVEVSGEVRYIFARAVPGAPETQRVAARASAMLEQQ